MLENVGTIRAYPEHGVLRLQRFEKPTSREPAGHIIRRQLSRLDSSPGVWLLHKLPLHRTQCLTTPFGSPSTPVPPQKTRQLLCRTPEARGVPCTVQRRNARPPRKARYQHYLSERGGHPIGLTDYRSVRNTSADLSRKPASIAFTSRFKVLAEHRERRRSLLHSPPSHLAAICSCYGEQTGLVKGARDTLSLREGSNFSGCRLYSGKTVTIAQRAREKQGWAANYRSGKGVSSTICTQGGFIGSLRNRCRDSAQRIRVVELVGVNTSSPCALAVRSREELTAIRVLHLRGQKRDRPGPAGSSYRSARPSQPHSLTWVCAASVPGICRVTEACTGLILVEQ
ncbi:unnamed protein product [Pleuronectes platessa]|uniref:Uncharacterized protein n=1 Tax=Pleuronectes platessa TaxID=8262 RepID=A0A9N7UYD0_PLEPL|nr:unnamed protein product [Pleuronectes platessa]